MKHLFTSNYPRCGRDPNAVVISCTFPKWFPESEFKGVKRLDLAPEWWMVKKINDGEITSEEYDDLYMYLLIEKRQLTAEWIISSLKEGSILICYEKPGEKCHRRTLANWLQKETGIIIPEWLTPAELKKEKERQQKEQLVDSLLKF